MSVRVTGIDHIQIAAPQGCEAAAREFYGSLLGLQEIEKPESLRSRGGCWFQCGNQQVHVGIEQNFSPAKKAHPAFVTSLISMNSVRLSSLAASRSPTTIQSPALAASTPKTPGAIALNS
jgi:hypothetical protein